MKVLDVNINATNLDQAFSTIDQWITERKKVYVCVAPVSTVVACQKDQEYKRVVNSADLVTPDGMPLVWIGKMRGFKEIARTYGPDLMRRICEQGQAKGYRHYFYGASAQTLDLLEKKLQNTFSDIEITGKHSPPFGEISDQELNNDLDRINEANPDILWVGLGSPKQDFWMHKNRDKLETPVIIGVGAAFDFLSGMKKQAPRWMQNVGLEWLFRLCSEPRRLWRRYLIGNAVFVFLIVKEFIKSKLIRY